MTELQTSQFIERIKNVTLNDEAKFGTMNVRQMICHCSDQFRMMFGEVEGLVREEVDLQELQKKIMKGESVSTVKGLDQAAGEGTAPGNFEKDKETLINYLNRFNETDENYEFSFHPFFGVINRERWERLVTHHLNHHLSQFGR